MIKRISSVAVIIAMLFSMMCSFTVYAENDLMQMELTSAPTTVGRGDTVTITAAIKNYTPADTLAVFVEYDADVLAYSTNASNLNLDELYDFNPGKVMGETTGIYGAWAGVTNFEPKDGEGNPTDTFDLWTLTFTVADDAPVGTTTLTYSFDEAQCNVWSDEANDSLSLVAGVDYVKDSTITLNIVECVHDYTDVEYTRPAVGTAREDAQHSLICNKCDAPVYEDCSFDKGSYTAATCTAAGYTTYTCTVCGYSVVETDPNAPVLEHKYEYTYSGEGEDHKHTITCEDCDLSEEESCTIGDWVVTQQPTKDQVGIKERGCEKCDYVEREEIAKIPYFDLTAESSVIPGKTWTVDVAVKNNPGLAGLNLLLDYDTTALKLTGAAFKDDNTNGFIDFEDGEVVIVKWPAIAGDDAIITLTFEALETAAKGEYTLTVSAEKAVDGSDMSEFFEIEEASITLNIVECEHDYTDVEYTRPAVGTAREDAQHSLICNKCDAPVYEDCSFDKGSYTAATCTAAGYTTYTCTVCGYSVVETDPNAPALNHKFEHDEGTEGADATMSCTRCEDTAFDGVPCDFDDGVYTGATCDEAGYTRYTCQETGYYYDVVDPEAPALGHHYVHDEGTEGAEATMSCDQCDDAEHDGVPCAFDAGVKSPATCEKAGTITYTCQETNYSYVVDDPEAPALGHHYVHDEGTEGANATMSCDQCDDAEHDGVPCAFDAGVKSPATCEKAGTIKYTCQETGYNYTVDDPDAPALEHKYEYTYSGEGEDHKHTITCENCDLSEEEACTIGEWEVTKQPSKDETGLRVRGCEKCDYTEEEVIAKLAYFAATAAAEASAGDEWTVDIAVKNNPGVSGITLQVEFDDSVMTLTSAELSEEVNGLVQIGNHTNGITKIPMGLNPAHEGEKTIITLTFKIANKVEEGDYTVRVFAEDATDGAKPMPNQITIEETTVTVNVTDSFIWGDVNDSGDVTLVDALYILRYLAQMMTLDDMEKPAAADTNYSGDITLADSLLILRYLAQLYDPANPDA